jgi:hypothetical protein
MTASENLMRIQHLILTIRPDQLHDPNLPAGARTVNRWFDPTAFGAPTPGSFGTVRRAAAASAVSALIVFFVVPYFRRRGCI